MSETKTDAVREVRKLAAEFVQCGEANAMGACCTTFYPCDACAERVSAIMDALLSPAASPDATPAAKPDAPPTLVCCFIPCGKPAEWCIVPKDAERKYDAYTHACAEHAEELGVHEGEARRISEGTAWLTEPDAPGGVRRPPAHPRCTHGTPVGQRCPTTGEMASKNCGATTPPPSPPETPGECLMGIDHCRPGALRCLTCTLTNNLASRDAELAKVREEADNIHALWESTDLLARKQTGEIASLRSEAKLLSKQRDYFAGQRATTETELAKVRAEMATMVPREWLESERHTRAEQAARADTAEENGRRHAKAAAKFEEDAATLIQTLTAARDAAEARATEAERLLSVERQHVAALQEGRDAAESQLAAERRRVEEAQAERDHMSRRLYRFRDAILKAFAETSGEDALREKIADICAPAKFAAILSTPAGEARREVAGENSGT